MHSVGRNQLKPSGEVVQSDSDSSLHIAKKNLPHSHLQLWSRGKVLDFNTKGLGSIPTAYSDFFAKIVFYLFQLQTVLIMPFFIMLQFYNVAIENLYVCNDFVPLTNIVG